MAMTILGSPASADSAHNDLFYVVDSTNKAQPNFKYILDVYIGGNKIATLKNRPNPAYTNYGVFNVNKVVQAYLGRYFKPVTGTITGHKVDYVVKLSESYGTTLNVDVVVDSTRTAYNSAFKYPGGVQLIDQWATQRPKVAINIEDDNDYFVCLFRSASSTYTITSYDGYDCTGSVLATITATGSADVVVNLKPSLYALNNPLSYKAFIGTDTLKFNICDPTPYETVPLHFMNRAGGYDTVYFRLVSKKTVEVDRKVMQGQGYAVSVSGVSFSDTNNVMYDTLQTYSATYKESWRLTSEPMTDAEYDWLDELYTSTSIYTKVGSNYVPVMIKDGSYEKKKRMVDGITNIQLTIEFGQVNNSQYR
jgi:hypothetical protein